MDMRTKVFIGFLLIRCLACDHRVKGNADDAPVNEMHFDATKWKTEVDKDYPYRDSMLKDLMEDDSIRQLNGNEVLALLG